MRKLLIIPLLALMSVFCSCEKMTDEEKEHETEMNAIKRMDNLIKKHPATPDDMTAFVSTLTSDMVYSGEYIEYRNGIVTASNLTIKMDGTVSSKYGQDLMVLAFMDDGTCRKYCGIGVFPFAQKFYAALQWSYDINTMSIRLVDEDLAARGCKNAETSLRLRYYGNDMYILDGLMPTPEDYDGKDCMYRHFIDRTKVHDRQWYLDNYVDEKLYGLDN